MLTMLHVMIGGHAQKESISCRIIILLTPAPIIDPFRAWKPPLCHKDTVKGKTLVGGLGALSCVFMAYWHKRAGVAAL